MVRRQATEPAEGVARLSRVCGAPLQAQDQQDRTLIQLSAPFQANPGLLQLPPSPGAAALAAIALAAAAAAELAAAELAAAAAASGTTPAANADGAAATRARGPPPTPHSPPQTHTACRDQNDGPQRPLPGPMGAYIQSLAWYTSFGSV